MRVELGAVMSDELGCTLSVEPKSILSVKLESILSVELGSILSVEPQVHPKRGGPSPPELVPWFILNILVLLYWHALNHCNCISPSCKTTL